MKQINAVFHLKDYTSISRLLKKHESLDILTSLSSEEEQKLRAEAEKLLRQMLTNSEKSEEKIKVNGKEQKIFDTWLGQMIVLGSFSAEITADENFQYQTADPAYEIHAQIEITSRFDDDPQKPYFLTAMILRMMNERTPDMINEIRTHDTSLLDYMLVYLFRKRLKEAMRSGCYRTYVRRECNDTRLRGRIDIARHIRLNLGQNNGKIACSYQERTADNALNQLILCAYEYLLRTQRTLTEFLFREQEANAAIRTLKFSVPVVPDVRSLLMMNLRPIAHPYFADYEALRQICFLILRKEGLNLSGGINPKSLSLLFSSSEMWEKYLEDIIQRRIQETKQDFVLEAQYRIKFIWGNCRIPDFVLFGRDADGEYQPLMVLDAKHKANWYKRFKQDKENMQSKTHDKLKYEHRKYIRAEEVEEELKNFSTLKDVDTCIKYLVMTGAAHFMILYPSDSDKEVYFNIEEIGTSMDMEKTPLRNRNQFSALPFYIPSSQDKNYSEWEQEFQEYLTHSADIILRKADELAGN